MFRDRRLAMSTWVPALADDPQGHDPLHIPLLR